MALFSAVALAMTPALAQQTKSATKGVQSQQQQPNVIEFDKQMAQAQENMRKMQEQMDTLRQTRDPQDRQKLLQEHWATMQATMGMMHGMWGTGMMGCCGGAPVAGTPMMGGHMTGGGMMHGPMMGWGNMGDYYSKLTPEQMKQRQYMMDQYMGMQQMMMDHMMGHQSMMQQPAR
ncbi:hypothetical protein [Cupriavidus sp. Marseille-Q8015]